MRSAVLALVGALALVACGRSGGGDGAGTVVTSVPRDDVYETPKDPCPDGVKIRLLGANPGAVSSLVLHLAGGLHVRELGSDLPIEQEIPPFLMLDVSTDAHSHDLGVFRLPTHQITGSAPVLGVELSFAHAIATVGDRHGELSDCGDAMSFWISPGQVNRDRCEVHIVLDVGRSVTTCGDGLSFLPHFRVFY